MVHDGLFYEIPPNHTSHVGASNKGLHGWTSCSSSVIYYAGNYCDAVIDSSVSRFARSKPMV